MIGKILAYLAGVITGFALGLIYASVLFDYLIKFIPMGAWDENWNSIRMVTYYRISFSFPSNVNIINWEDNKLKC